LFFGIGGLIGVGFLRRALGAVFETASQPPPPPPPLTPRLPGEPVSNEPIRIARPRPQAAPAITVFRIWAVIFGAVGAQMGWILRPFIGTPTLPFQLFRPRESHFFAAVARAIASLFS
jgi:hypothetical protein